MTKETKESIGKAIRDWLPLGCIVLTTLISVGYYKSTFDQYQRRLEFLEKKAEEHERNLIKHEGNFNLINYRLQTLNR